MDEQISEYIATNMRKLRETLDLTQQQMASRAGIPRATWANLESGGANPTVAVLVKVANALQVRIEELLGPPKASARHYKASDMRTRTRGGVLVRALLPDSVPGLDLERMVLPPGARMAGVPHTAGTREYLTCESGTVELAASGSVWRLEEGDVVVFRGDQKHSYSNPGRVQAVAYSVIAFAPVAG